ncbi:MAG TPA: LuxR C-terminal-related transcriptional regulator [Chloroflexia bacterium]|nr:LuxR C-terminal-related transcriptional regulator [Chloroflexia bacterium]
MMNAFQGRAAASLENAPDNLPVHFSSFVGRQRELAEIRRLLKQTSLLTLTGPGGVGKTRLSVQYARAEAADYPGGVCFVELAPLTGERFIMDTLVQSLNLKDTFGQTPQEALLNFLQNRQLLLILDNCEHLLVECARLASLLLAKSPLLKIVATSREGLGIEGETTLRVASLAVPGYQNLPPVENIPAYDGVRLFMERSGSADPAFSLSETNAKAVAQICAQLDGIPLALELAAARLRTMPVEQLANRLDDRFRLLTGGNRVSLPRQQTLRALVDWSYNLLDLKEKVVLRRLAVFAGKWTLEAAEEICQGSYSEEAGAGDLKREEALELVLSLANKSLIQLDKEEGRYFLLETIRQYAREKLAEAGETEKYLKQYRDWYLRFALEAQKHLNGPQQMGWKKRIVQEHIEIRAALDWSLRQGELYEAASIILALWHFWHSTANFEAISWLNQVYRLSEKIKLPPEVEVKLYNALGTAQHSIGNFGQAEVFHQKALQIWREQGDKANIAKALLDLGWYYQFQLKLAETELYAQESLQIAREIGDKRAIAAALHLRGMALSFGSRLPEALPEIEAALAIWRELGDLDSIASSLMLLAQTEVRAGNLQRGRALLAEALPLQLELQNLIGVGVSLSTVAILVIASRKTIQNARLSARFMGANYNLYSKLMQLGVKKPGMAVAIEDPLIEELERILGEEGYAREFEAGTRMNTEEALNLAIEQVKARPEEESVSAAAFGYPGGLSEREIEVLRLVAAGLSNPEIADKLVLSRRTVEAHLRSIFNKLEVTSRTSAARYAIEHNLI